MSVLLRTPLYVPLVGYLSTETKKSTFHVLMCTPVMSMLVVGAQFQIENVYLVFVHSDRLTCLTDTQIVPLSPYS